MSTPSSQRSAGPIRFAIGAFRRGWVRFADRVAAVWTFILLLILFLFVVGPIALLMRIFRQNPMRAPRLPESFWVPREKREEGLEDCRRQF